MRLTILLSLVIAITITWLALTLMRDHATRMQSELSVALAYHMHSEQMHRIAEHDRKETRRRAERGELPGLEGRQFDLPSNPPPELPEWIQRRVTVDENGTMRSVGINQTFGIKLSRVPAGWFHGAFALGIMVLCGLALVEARSPGT